MKLRVRAEVLSFKDGKVLCHWNRGYATFPGGGVDPNESPVKAAKRECMEEADRVLVNCVVAHEPTTQTWPAGYAKREKWAKGYEGGLTYWMTGTTSETPFHHLRDARHKDYEEFEWKPLEEVITRLKEELKGDWHADVEVRLKLLETQVEMAKPIKAAWSTPMRLPELT